MKKPIYKTLITIEVLSENPIESISINDIANNISYGDWSGVTNFGKSEKLVGKKAVDAIINQGTSIEFFNMDTDGNEDDY